MFLFFFVVFYLQRHTEQHTTVTGLYSTELAQRYRLIEQ
jgi:hypothetical protein